MQDEQQQLQDEWVDLIFASNEIVGEILLQVKLDGFEGSNAHRKLLRRQWEINAEILRRYDFALNRFGASLNPPPSGIFLRLAAACEEMSRGIIPKQIELTRSGGRPMTHYERQEISRAVFFLLAVESGEISCSSPVKTVADCFNVTKQAARGWKARAEEICKDMPRPHPNLIEESMRHAGKRYSVRGRGAPSS